MTSQMTSEPRTHNEYNVGWVCALPKEQTAATAMLDQIHVDLPKPPNDPNTYTLGSIGKHNIVIACLPKGKIGTNSAATVGVRMVETFPSIKFGFMVGIGGGIPPKVRLGDVVVGTPVGSFSGVVQWDFGKANEGGVFEQTGSLNHPPTSLLTALTKLETEHELTGSKIPEYLDELKEKWPRLAPKYLKTDSLKDVLFKADYGHGSKSTGCEVTPDVDGGDDEEESCQFCDKTQVVERKPRDMRVHYGLIASGNQVIKDAAFRDRLNKNLGGHVLCVEMEAAGLIDNFPCIVIRGICDYADSHKNKDWQEHAAATAAAFAKELLEYVQPDDVDREPPVKDMLRKVNTDAKDSKEQMPVSLAAMNEYETDTEYSEKLTLSSVQGAKSIPISLGLINSPAILKMDINRQARFLKEFEKCVEENVVYHVRWYRCNENFLKLGEKYDLFPARPEQYCHPYEFFARRAEDCRRPVLERMSLWTKAMEASNGGMWDCLRLNTIYEVAKFLYSRRQEL